MRVLYLCHRIPYPPDKGDKIRAFHQVRAMAARHQVDLFTMADDASDLAHESVLRRYCGRVTVARLNPRFAHVRAIPYLFTRQPLTLPYFYCKELRREVARAVAAGSYDRIFVYCSAMAQYVESAWEIPVVTDFVDVDSDKWTQYANFTRWPFAAVYRREGHTLRAYERQICERSACVLVTTRREADLVARMSPRTRVHVVANGVDTDYFQPAGSASTEGAPVIGFTGDMSYFPNIEAVTYFARTVLPLIRQSVPGAQFLIVGRNPGRRVKMLEEMGGVTVTGFVPDVRDYLARMQVAVAPFSIAAGIQNKVLEAMASGIPIVCTPRAAQGLSSATAGAVEMADGADEMAARVAGLLRDPERARASGLHGREVVQTEYRWDQALHQLVQLLEDPVSPGPRIAPCAGKS